MIKLENVSMSYPVAGLKSHSLQARMYHRLSKVVGGSLALDAPTTHVHALKNINLEIQEGQRVGIYGHNGAGKTTLLRVLSKVYTPTSGRAIIKGRINALTDFTLGMEPDATGIKNIIFRLIFMGYTFKEAKASVDAIADFAELGDFIHLPIRTYSTGMFMRLAFAISTHFMPDILILDEMIGTGDEAFKEKCKQRTQDLFQQSRIIVLSTHDVASLKEYCDTVVIMEHGEIVNVFKDNTFQKNIQKKEQDTMAVEI